MTRSEQIINYLDSFCADTEIVPKIISQLITDLKKINYGQDEIDEIVLSMDESITNAVQETLKTHTDCSASDENHPDITIRYNITDNEFNATIIDHGKGLDIFNIVSSLPDRTSHDYHNQIHDYAKTSSTDRIKVRINGEEIPIKGVGAGLKIILTFMDAVTIDLIDKQTILSTSVSEHTDGTIFNMKRKRRY